MSEEAGPSPVAIRPAGPFDLALLAELHAACFAERWDVPALASLLAMPGALALLAGGPLGPGEGPRDEQSPGEQPPGEQPPGEQPLGFVLLRAIAGEAEIISIGVRPEARRRGIGRRLLAAALAAAAAAGAENLFLEVAADNWQALGLYLSHDFTEVGRRPNYYQRNGGGIMALVLSKPILPRAEGGVR
ncbi:MAG TPA: GNAT family N-acetyltransferase [Verrucomicrobiae bacterium]|nr:GNAT family N-acetyltransferase [Verrucomicrobiae bacterium]